MASYTKLRDGSWGLRIEGSATAGQELTVTTKAGEKKTEKVGKVLWQGNGVTLATIAGKEQQSNRPLKRHEGHACRNGHHPHPGPCCNGRHGGGYDCGADCCEMD